MMMSAAKVGIVCSILLTLLMPQPAAAQDQWKGTVVKEGDITIVKNPKEPIYRTPILELKEELSIGGPEAKGQAVFDHIREFVVDDIGNFFISDSEEKHIKVFDKSGRYLRTIGRPGQGPGEFDGIMGLSIVRTTGELAVNDVLQRRLSFFKTDGTFLRDLQFGESRISYALLDSRGNIYAAQTFVDAATSLWEYRLVVLAQEGKLIQALAREPQSAPNKIKLFMPKSYWTLDLSDNLIYGHSGDYEVRFFESGTHKLFKKVQKEFVAVPVSDEVMKKFRRPEYSAMNVEFAKEHPAFLAFFVSDTGHLFVETFEMAGDGRFVHDVFDSEGRLLARMPLKPRGLKISQRKFYALEEDEDGYQYVKRYSVTWKVK